MHLTSIRRLDWLLLWPCQEIKNYLSIISSISNWHNTQRWFPCQTTNPDPQNVWRRCVQPSKRPDTMHNIRQKQLHHFQAQFFSFGTTYFRLIMSRHTQFALILVSCAKRRCQWQRDHFKSIRKFLFLGEAHSSFVVTGHIDCGFSSFSFFLPSEEEVHVFWKKTQKDRTYKPCRAIKPCM